MRLQLTEPLWPKRALFLCCILAALFPVRQTCAQSAAVIRLNDGWEFVQGDLGGVWEALRMERTAVVPVWEKVALPHSYNAFDAVDPDAAYYQGPAWYRTRLELKNPRVNGRILLHFEGAGQKTKVWVYDRLAGEHTGGYDEFTFDITDAVAAFLSNKPVAETFNGLIPVVVRCDNSRDLEMIPSDLSDFNLYGGLYRYVNLVYSPAVSAGNIWITPEYDIKTGNATAKIEVSLYNPTEYKGSVEFEIEISDPAGRKILTEKSRHGVFKGKRQVFTVRIPNPELWSVTDPSLYQVQLKTSSATGTEEVRKKFGIRHFHFEEHGPFYLNGERLFLRGTHRHEDHAGVGPAMTEEMMRQEMTMMKEMGVNFLRLGHYQQSRIILELCDELGILVWEEIPWCRGGLGGKTYREQARRMLENMINQHYNHPSVILWGLGNENDWPGDFPVFDTTAIRSFMKELHELSHKLDPGRKTAIRRCDFCADIIDVYSPSIWAGWYRGKYTDYYHISETWNRNVPHFLHVEWGADNHPGRFTENPDAGLENISADNSADERGGDFLMSGGEARVSKDGDWSESYACNMFDWHLKEQEKMDWHTGTAQWPFKDFSTPIRPENPVPFMNQKGLVERDLRPKTAYYLFQSYWAEKPMIHIYSHNWTTRWGERNEPKLLKVYSNCGEAELFLNGKSMGTRERNSQDFPAAGLRWRVLFREGENHVKVIGLMNGVQVSDEMTINYQTESWSQPAKLLIDETGRRNDTVTLRVIAIDEKGVMCLDANNLVRFRLSGDGDLLDNLGVVGGSRVVQLANGNATIGVRLNSGNSVVSVSSEGLPSSFMKLHAKTCSTLNPGEPITAAGPGFPPAKEILKTLEKVCNWQMNNLPPVRNRHYRHNDWTNASLYTGIMEFYRISGKKKYYNRLRNFGEEVNWRPAQRFRHSDDLCIGQTFVEMFEVSGDRIMLEPIKARIDSLIADPMPGRVDWWWCDALYMEPPLLARLAHVTGEQKYLDYMNGKWWDAYDFLYDKKEKLFYRDDRYRIKEDGSGRREADGSKVFWSRGNGWVLAGIARVLQYMPEHYPARQQYIELFRQMAYKIASLQDEDGLWRPGLLYPDPYPHGETSGSGFFCYAMAWGVNTGILEKEIYLPVIQRSWKALNDCVNKDGRLGWVQQIGAAPDKISEEMTEVYGVGAFLLAGSEIIKMQRQKKEGSE